MKTVKKLGNTTITLKKAVGKTSKSARIRDYISANPSTSVKTLVRLFHVTPALVYQLRHEIKKARMLVDTTIVPTLVKATAPLHVPHIQLDLVNSPPHYTAGGIETIDFIQAKLTPEQFKGYLLGNILKYSSRIGLKGQEAQDAGKLNWYTRRLDAAYQALLNDK